MIACIYLIIGFIVGMLLNYNINDEIEFSHPKTAKVFIVCLDMLFWPIVVLLYLFINIIS